MGRGGRVLWATFSKIFQSFQSSPFTMAGGGGGGDSLSPCSYMVHFDNFSSISDFLHTWTLPHSSLFWNKFIAGDITTRIPDSKLDQKKKTQKNPEQWEFHWVVRHGRDHAYLVNVENIYTPLNPQEIWVKLGEMFFQYRHEARQEPTQLLFEESAWEAKK